eukprot:6103558-Amphidinium_carterae.1
MAAEGKATACAAGMNRKWHLHVLSDAIPAVTDGEFSVFPGFHSNTQHNSHSNNKHNFAFQMNCIQ